MRRDILFLDIDGVVRTTEGDEAGPKPIAKSVFQRPFSGPAISALNEIVAITRCSIVITSTWRVTLSLEELRAKFWKEGFYGTIDDTTPALGTGRGTEIQTWIDYHGCHKYVIVDDMITDIQNHFEDRLVVKVDPRKGLNDSRAFDKIIEAIG
jgi:hypothetical protein